MKIQSKVYLLSIASILFLLAGLPGKSAAQRFGHGGGGGARPMGGGARPMGGGARPMGGGGEARPMGGGVRQAAPVERGSINGGGRNIGAHIFGAPRPAVREGGPVVRMHNNESVYHHGGNYHAYAYHPYHPFYWGPRWHPVGYFANTLAADAIMISLANQQYYYEDGVYYAPSSNGYTVVAPPVGAVVRSVPAGYVTVMVGDDIYYYYGGAFYVSQGGSFMVVQAPEGAIVSQIPDGATEQNVNGQYLLYYNNTYYQPISQDGQDAYEVVSVN